MKLSKLIFPMIITMIIAIGIFSCTGKSTDHSGVKYYRQLQFSETPYDIEKGTHEITAEQAKTINSYKFTYDNTGRLLSVGYERNGVLLDYSSMGAAKITYDYVDRMQTKHYFDKNNLPIESGGAFAAQYALDTEGKRVGLMYLGKDGSMIENRNGIHSYNWNVMPDGLVRELRYNLEGEETIMNQFCPFYELRFTYNEKGYATRMANYKADTLYNCTAENCGDIGVSYFAFEPNENGDLLSFAVFNATGQMSNLYWGWSKRLSKYDENGYLIEARVYDQDNEYVGGKQIPVTQNTYDEHGALVEVKNLDKDGNLINSAENGVAVTSYKYDEAGNRTDTLTFDKDNAPVKLALQ